MTCVPTVVLCYTLSIGPLVDTKWADVEWGVEALNPYSNMWGSGPVIENFFFEEGTILYINFNFRDFHTGGSPLVDFFIVDEENYLKWENQLTADKYLLTEVASALDINWTTPHDANWYFVWDTAPHNTAVADLRVELVHYEILPFGDKIVIDRRPLVSVLLVAITSGTLFLIYGFSVRNKMKMSKESYAD